MIVHCEKCGRNYDDAARWTICPHNNLAVRSDAPYCAKHDLYNCPECTESEQDALGVMSRVKKNWWQKFKGWLYRKWTQR